MELGEAFKDMRKPGMKFQSMSLLGVFTFFSMITTMCSYNKDYYFRIDNISEIRIQKNQEEKIYTVSDKKLVGSIIEKINRKRKEPIKFMPEYILYIEEGDKAYEVLVRSDEIKIEGRTFISDEDISQFIAVFITDL